MHPVNCWETLKIPSLISIGTDIVHYKTTFLAVSRIIAIFYIIYNNVDFYKERILMLEYLYESSLDFVFWIVTSFTLPY